MSIMPVFPRWVVFHLWASRHVLHRCRGAHVLFVINPGALWDVLEPWVFPHIPLKQESPLHAEAAPQTPSEQNLHGTKAVKPLCMTLWRQMHVIIDFSRPTEHTTLRVNLSLDCEHGVILICQCKFIQCNKCTTMEGALTVEEAVSGQGQG